MIPYCLVLRIPLLYVSHMLIMNSAQQSAVLSGHIETSDIAGALDSSSVINTEENKEKMASANIPEKTDRKFLEGIKTQLQRCFITAANNSIGN